MSEPLLIAPRDQTGSRWAAKRMGHVAICAKNAVGCQGIEVRRRDVQAPIETYVAVTQIVRQNNNNIRRPRLRQGRGSKSANDEQQRQKTLLHNTHLVGACWRCPGWRHCLLSL